MDASSFAALSTLIPTPCPVCTGPGAPRPSGTGTYTFSGVRHEALECAAIGSVGEISKRDDDNNGYVTESGTFVCLECFPYGKQHTYAPGTAPHDEDNRPDRRSRHDTGQARSLFGKPKGRLP